MSRIRYSMEQIQIAQRGGDIYNLMDTDIRRWVSLVIKHFKKLDWDSVEPFNPNHPFGYMVHFDDITMSVNPLHIGTFAICYARQEEIPTARIIWFDGEFKPIPRTFTALLWQALPDFISGAANRCPELKVEVEDFMRLATDWPQLNPGPR